MVEIECLDLWPSEITAEQAEFGERLGIDYKLTNNGSTEQTVTVRGYIGDFTAAVHGETVPPNGGTEYGTVFMTPAGVQDGAQARVEIAGQESTDSGSGSGSDSDTSGGDSGGSSGPTGSVTLTNVEVNRGEPNDPSTVSQGEWLDVTSYVESTYSESTDITLTTTLDGTIIDEYTATIGGGQSVAYPRDATYNELIGLGFGGQSSEVEVHLDSPAPINTGHLSGGSISVAPQGDLRIRSVSPSQTSIGPGEELTITLELENLTGSGQTVSIDFLLGSEQVGGRTLTVTDQLTTHTTTVTYSEIESLYSSVLDKRVFPMARVTSPAVTGELKDTGSLVSVAPSPTAGAPASALSLSSSSLSRAFRTFSRDS